MTAPPIEVHALLVCRKVTSSADGHVGLEDVVEIVAAEKLPGDVGPLCFVAFVRHLPTGPGRGAFVVRTAPPDARDLVRLPLEVNIPAGYQGRQVALQVRVPALPLERGGWYEVGFEWEGRGLAANRFAVGVRS
jgi:hypothetical protein